MFENVPPAPPLEFFKQPDPLLKERKRKIWETYFTFLSIDTIQGEPLTLAKFESLHPPTHQPCFRSGEIAHYYTMPFVRETTCGFRWHCVRTRVVPGSRGLCCTEQKALLTQFPECEVPCALVEAMKEILFFQMHPFRRYANRRYLGSSTVSARCADIVDEQGSNPEVGLHDRRGLCISVLSPERSDPNVGIAAALKFPL